MADKVSLAVDLGASGGRVVAGIFDGGKLRLEEVSRFANGPINVTGRLHWDLLGLWSHVTDGLRSAAERYSGRVASVGVDTWGVDYGLLGKGDELLGNPYHYRDRRTDGVLAKLVEVVPREEIFAQTGLQFLPINTLFQVYASKLAGSPLLEKAERFLMMPDLFHWLLTGVKANERTNASTSQFYDPRKRAWATPLFDKLGLPTKMLGDFVDPGTTLGPLRADVATETNLAGVKVIAPGTHDTASAVMAVPAASRPGERPDWCYISSGTWSLMGVETPEPVVTDEVRKLNYTNEGGVGGTTRLLKNITGLWIVQECRKVWHRAGQDYTWEGLTRLADEEAPLVSLIDPDHSDFATPGDMPEAIRGYCRRTGQPVPQSTGEVVRTALESLALKSRYVLGGLEQLVGGRLDTVHIVGGGTQNRLLCQLTADACGRRVLAGPIEATALGNALMQLLASGEIGSIAEARQVVRRSFDVEEFLPRNPSMWDVAYERFLKLLSP